ncbi:MAG: zinc-binding dehydrogenase [Cytophagales bacterium]|nr:zinc-binding dehydrogenase [Bernardetiaceae bacterium]MDW8205260.1 zinc-binding dehydrogenase [Cytophagales bacterium]
MKALQLTDHPEQRIQLLDVPKPVARRGEALIRMQAAALNHRDEWIRQGKYPHIRPFCTLGSDGCGVVEAVGDNVDAAWIGKTVIINPNQNWGSNPAVQGKDYRILGNPTDGTFAEYIAVPIDRLHEKPAYLTVEQAAALPLGGLTAYRATCKHGAVKKNDRVLITGIGGGVAQLAMQFALAAGAQVWVSSGEEEKLQRAIALGAQGGVNYKNDNWDKLLMEQTGGLHLVIDSAGGVGFSRFIRLMQPAGKIVFYGATAGLPTTLDLHRIFFYQITIQGSTMGNDAEFAEMLQFCEKHRIAPIIDSVRPLDEIISAFDDMKSGKQFGKLVISIA